MNSHAFLRLSTAVFSPFPASRLALPTAFLFFVSGFFAAAQSDTNSLQNYLGPRFAPSGRSIPAQPAAANHGASAAEFLRHWNAVAIDASGLDHKPVAPGDPPHVFGQQLGPARASRAMAIVHIAMFDAVNAVNRDYQGYTDLAPFRQGVSMNAAIAQAAHDTLVAMFPSQQSTFDQSLAAELGSMPNNRPKAKGVDLGHRAALAILALRYNDGSQLPEPHIGLQFFTSNDPGKWRKDPVSGSTLALGAYWGSVQPFVIQSSTQFRAPVPPAIDSAEYATAYQEAKDYGGDVDHTSTMRTPDQTEIGIFWAYDGMPSLCAPPRLYNQITMHIADQLGTSSNPVELARLLALVNVSMADAAIAIWESKYFYQYWRPVTGIREADLGTGPSLLGDNNPATTGDTGFMPLGAPASNLTGPNFTPPFPSYPSGHGGFGGALFESLRNFYGRDNIAFTFTSDEFNGITLDNQGNPRPVRTRSFSSLSQAEEENGQSRIYLGIHWSFDKTAAIAQGRQVADYVFAHAFMRALGKHGR